MIDMSIQPDRIRQILRYAVAVASKDDDERRELGPIHLVKYAYLADLAYAKKHDGASYTGLPWRFYHFGPWAPEASREIKPAMDVGAIRHRTFQGPGQDDVSRWRVDEPEWEERLEEDLPFEVASAVRSAVREFANDTPGLLHHVYRTPPMLRAAPGETLDLMSVVVSDEDGERESREEPSLSKTAERRRRAAREALRARFRKTLEQRRRERPARITPPPPPYDEVFAKGQEWLDALAGEPIRPIEGELIVCEEIWKSPTRSEPSVP